MIYTSYYAKLKKLDLDKYLTVAISATVPDGVVTNMTIPDYSPDSKILYDYKGGRITKDEYTTEYLSKLFTLGRSNILNNLLEIHELAKSTNKDVLLLCWESGDKFCHRHLLASYLKPELLIPEL